MSLKYVCPHCGAYDSSKCDFPINDRTGSVTTKKQDGARKVGCRVMHYTDKFKATGSYDD